MNMTDRRLAHPKPQPRVLAKRKKRLDAAKAEILCRAEVRRLYGSGCAIPGCREKAVHQHHLVYRSRSKRLMYEPTNRAPLCVSHHRLVHDGLIHLRRDEDGELIVSGPKDLLKFKL